MLGVVILGVTGSIGQQTLEVLDYLNVNSEKYKLIGVSCHRKTELLATIIDRYKPALAVVTEEESGQKLKGLSVSGPTEIMVGPAALKDVIEDTAVDIIVNALVGISGLEPSITALKANKRLALANKESLVAGGALIKKILAENKGVLLPVDSEHSALWQLLRAEDKPAVKKLILTASGGPFRQMAREKFASITPAMALRHPTWDMGGKISIDSATLMNKALEVIEAHWLFDFPYDKIDVIVHPESIVHSFVELADNSLLAHLGVADMKTPILYALTYPQRQEGVAKTLSLSEQSLLTFEEPRWKDFPALRLGFEAGRAGGTMPVVLNGANEVAVAAFLKGQISFTDIALYVEKVMIRHDRKEGDDLETILAADLWARQEFYKEVG